MFSFLLKLESSENINPNIFFSNRDVIKFDGFHLDYVFNITNFIPQILYQTLSLR